MTVLLRIHDTENNGDEYKLFDDSLIKPHNKQTVYETYLNQLNKHKQDVVLEFIYPDHKEYLITLNKR